MIVLSSIVKFTYGTDIDNGSECCNHTKLKHEGLSIDDSDMGI